MACRIYRLEPAAAPYDTNWDRAPSRGVVIVRARSAADARLVASEAEAQLDVGGPVASGEENSFASAFRDDKLYHVVEETGDRFDADGDRAVLDGLSVDGPSLK